MREACPRSIEPGLRESRFLEKFNFRLEACWRCLGMWVCGHVDRDCTDENRDAKENCQESKN